ncbi:helix-turn-helix domain-containing protein [Naasia sp. SYSU D00948]|uniref:AraC family transcriptional regulator n=1 Tax=Naasia sp. SYSU D00948 TaxID=2817379 RepID=UPI001B307978|nr:helix-turn-helix domain-containing protein [Naasia sp. SYSU D00948]
MSSAASPAGSAADRPLRRDERTGVLEPDNLERYGARWFEPSPAVSTVVERYWHVRWRLPPGDVIPQRIIDAPAVTLSIETGAVPAPLIVTGPQQRAWTREIRDTGSAFGIRLRPAGLALLGSLSPQQVSDRTLPLTPDLDPALHALATEIAAAGSPDDLAATADHALARRLAERTVPDELLLANAVVDELTRRVRSRTGPALAELFGVSERSVQRALQTTLGRGPKWVSRRIRLQEVARVLAVEPDADLAVLAAELGYTDQAHLIRDFRDVAGVTPGAYRRSLLPPRGE